MAYARAERGGLQFTWRTWSGLGVMLGALGTLHTMIFIPVIRAAVTADISASVQNHAGTRHAGSVSREEFTLIISQLNRIEARLDK